MKTSEECLAEYIYNRIVEGDYKLEWRESTEAIIYFKKSWWSGTRVYIKSRIMPNSSSFKYDGIMIYSDLVIKALELINARQNEINKQERLRDMASLVKDLGLDCEEKE